MEKIILFASDQWLLITAFVAAIWLLAWFEQRSAGTGLSVHSLTSLVNDGKAVVVDLREKVDFDAGHIVDAVNIPFSKWQSQQGQGGETELSQYKSRPVVLVCKLGQQSSHVARKLVAEDYDGIYRLSGGLAEWQNAQMPLVKS